jgi:UDPglucose--hexose-1-phosphate uridylyltransferase
VFDNDFAALTPDVVPEEDDRKGLLVAQSERGICRVVCFSPRHDLTLGQMPVEAIRTVVDTWVDQYVELGGLDWVRHVQVFENRGAMMGASNPHPHGQIWADERVPDEPAKELAVQRAHAASGGCLLCDHLSVELDDGHRVVTATSTSPHWCRSGRSGRSRPSSSRGPTPAPCPSSAPTSGTGWPTSCGA